MTPEDPRWSGDYNPEEDEDDDDGDERLDLFQRLASEISLDLEAVLSVKADAAVPRAYAKSRFLSIRYMLRKGIVPLPGTTEGEAVYMRSWLRFARRIGQFLSDAAINDQRPDAFVAWAFRHGFFNLSNTASYAELAESVSAAHELGYASRLRNVKGGDVLVELHPPGDGPGVVFTYLEMIFSDGDELTWNAAGGSLPEEGVVLEGSSRADWAIREANRQWPDLFPLGHRSID